MAQYHINVDGKKYIYSKYTKKGICSVKHIFPNGKETSKLIRTKNKKVRVDLLYKAKHKSELVRMIFINLFKIIIDKAAEGHMFVLPSTTGSNICLHPIPLHELKYLRQNGYYKDINVIKCNLQVPRFVFDLNKPKSYYSVRINVPKEYENKAFRLAEQQKLSWTYKIPQIL